MMKVLITEDDFTSRLLMQELLQPYGLTHVAADGGEAIIAVRKSLEEKDPYDLICLDIMMPGLDGQETLVKIRELESASGLDLGRGAKVLMTTALHDKGNIMQAFREQCDGYLVKPIEAAKLIAYLEKFSLIDAD